MKARCSCNNSGQPPAGIIQKVAAFLRWLLPGALLALMPKCPACLAAYIAMASGIGLSFSAAATLRWTLIGLCSCSLVFLAVRSLHHRRTRSS